MATEFPVRILTPGAELFTGQITEALIPSFGGEHGVLAGHQDFIGLLGTGVLKVVSQGDDYWFMISSGVYEIVNGRLTILTEVAEAAKDIDVESAKARVSTLEPVLATANTFMPQFEADQTEFERARARIEAYRRTHLVN